MTTLWCGLGGLNYYPHENQQSETERFLDRCAEAGVRSLRFYLSFSHWGQTVFRLWQPGRQTAGQALTLFSLYDRQAWDPIRCLVHEARERGLEAWGYTSPNYLGSLQANPHSPLGEKLPFLYVEPFANQHPEFWARDEQGQDSLERQGYVILSMAFAEVRKHLVGQLGQLAVETGMDGFELEWLVGSQTPTPFGFEAPSADIRTCTNEFVRQMQQALDGRARLSAAVAADLEHARRWAIDWAEWGQHRSVDQLVLRLRGRDLDAMTTQIKAARQACGGSTWLIAQLDCWHSDGWDENDALLRAAEAARTAGADEIGVYRADSVEAAGLWPAVAQIAAA